MPAGPSRPDAGEGEAHDDLLCSVLLAALLRKTCYSRIADTTQTGSGTWPASKGAGQLPPKPNRKGPICFGPYLFRAQLDRTDLQQDEQRRRATRYDKLAANYLEFVNARIHTHLVTCQ
jgi:hypothetical protein